MEPNQLQTDNHNGYFWYLISNQRNYCQFDVLWQDCLSGKQLVDPIYSPQCKKDIPCLFNQQSLHERKVYKCPSCCANWKTLVKDSILSTIANKVKDQKKKPIYIRFKDSAWAILGPKMHYNPFDWAVLTINQSISNFNKSPVQKIQKSKIKTVPNYDQSSLVATFQGQIYITEFQNVEAVSIKLLFEDQFINNWQISTISNGIFVGYSNGKIFFCELVHQMLSQGIYQLGFGVEQKSCKQLCIVENDLFAVTNQGIVRQYKNFLYSFNDMVIRKDIKGKILFNEQNKVLCVYEQDSNLIIQSEEEIQIDVGQQTKLSNYGLVYTDQKIFFLSFQQNVSSIQVCLEPNRIKKIKTKIQKPLSDIRSSDLICKYIGQDLQLKQFILKN